MTTVETPKATTRWVRLLSRRYYPLAIGAAFLGLVVGYFPSTVPSSSLGFVPKIKPPLAQAAPAPTAAPAPAAPAAPAPVPFPVTTDAGFDDSAVGSGATTASPTTAPSGEATTSTSGGTVGSGTHAICALPLPTEPPPPPAAELLEALSVAGPLGPEATAGTAALAPVIPVLAPLFPLAGGVAGGKSGILLSDSLVAIANLEDEVFAPFSSEIAAITPGAVTADENFYKEIGPLLTLASNLPDLACVGDVEIAAGATVAPAAYPGAIPLSAYGTSATAMNNRVVTVSTSWAEGVSPAFSGAIDRLVAEGVPVEIRLYDDAPAGHAGDTGGFAAWVTSTVSSFPKAAIWEIDPNTPASAPTGAVAPSDPAASLAAGLGAAAHARAPGQLLGVGLPVTTTSWLPQFATDLVAPVRAVLNFAGLDTTGVNGGAGLSPAGVHWIVTLLRQSGLAQAGLPAQIPLFVTVGTDAVTPAATQISTAAGYAATLAGLGVGLLSWSSPSTLGGQLLSDGGTAAALLDALARPPAP